MINRLIPWVAVLGPAAVLSAALLSQFVGGLNPCPMCIWQRWPHAIAIALGLVAVLLGRRGAPLFALESLTLLVGAGIGVFHAGVERGFWKGPSTCTGADLSQISVEDAINRIMNAPLVRCDEIPWEFLGLSMAGWNAVVSIGLAGAAWLAYCQASSSASQ